MYTYMMIAVTVLDNYTLNVQRETEIRSCIFLLCRWYIFSHIYIYYTNNLD